MVKSKAKDIRNMIETKGKKDIIKIPVTASLLINNDFKYRLTPATKRITFIFCLELVVFSLQLVYIIKASKKYMKERKGNERRRSEKVP